MEAILLNRLSKFIEEIKSLSSQAQNLCDNLNEENLDTSKVVSAKLKSILSRFSSELYNYFNICKNPDPDEISNFTTYQLQGEENLAELETKLKLKCEKPTTLAKEAEPSTYSKLPDLNLPQFSGDLLDWHQFWDQFNSSIIRRKLNDVDKLLYLKSSLKGDAARLVDGFNTTNKSYQIAVDTLRARYGKEHEVIHAHHRALNNVKRAENFDDCRTTLDELQRHLRVLQSMGENVDTNQMRFLVMEKFPADIIYDTKMRLGSDGTQTIENILEHLSLIVSTKEEAMRITQKSCTSNTVEVPYTTETLHVKDAANLEKPGPSKNSFSNGTKGFKTQQNNYKTRMNWNSKDKKPLKRKLDNKKEREAYKMGKKMKRWHCIFCGGDHLNVNCDKARTVDEQKAKLKDRCFNCFRKGHTIFQCRRKRKCEYCGKYGLHNQALCPNKFQGAKEEKASTSAMHISRKDTVLQTAVVKVRGHDNITRTCRILLDTGSGRSYITERMAKDLNLQAKEQNNLAIFTFGCQNPKKIKSPLVKLGITTRNNTVKTIFANVVTSISQGVLYPKELLGWKNDGNYPLADDGSLSDRIDILLGNDYYYTIMSTNKIQIGEDLYLVDSEFGWILSGRISTKPIEQLSVLTYFQTSCEVGLAHLDPPLDNGNLKRLWDLESIGITDSPKANRDEEAIKHFNETTEYRDKRYYVSWPWSDSPTNLPSNFGLAFGRLVNLLKRLDPETLILYDKTLKEQLNKGIIEEVPDGHVDHAVHYIAHHGVSAPGRSLRIVYDASARVKDNKSLNEHLYSGPLLLEDLTGLLIKFRCHAIGITADVEKAFLQIGLKQQDRDVTRFLWLKDLRKPAVDDNIMHLRFTRVPFGLTSSPFILNATIKHHMTKSENESIRKLVNDIYVDNLVTGTNSAHEALELYHDLKNTFNEISMNLRQWSSNSKDFLDHIPDACPEKIVKLLGLDWNLEDDTLSIRARVNENNKYTKRGILKTIAAVYDPCGFTVPIMLAAKILLQDLWRTKAKWDTALEEETVERWKMIVKDMKEVENVRVPRRITNLDDENAELHCFTDSSMQAYAAVVYLVQGNSINFLIGKSRLVPIKDKQNLKIPRLELLGVLIGSRLIKYVLKILKLNVTRQTLWTDSQVVIDWYNSDKLLVPFVARRLEEVKQNKGLIIRHVPSELNSADVGTRPSASEDERSRWLMGPKFLKKKHTEWPVGPSRTVSLLTREGLPNAESLQTDIRPDEELRSDKVLSEQLQESLEELPEGMKPEDSILKEIKKVQAEHFRDEVNGKETSLSRNLGLFKDIDDILRCKGRLKYAEWSFDKRYPVIIPKDCEFTNKVIKDTHEKNYHVGVNHTLSIIRQTYWIPQGKSQVRKILGKCPRCLKHGGGPYKLPSTPALPHERVTYSKPFTFTGTDYLGPILVKTEKGITKRWICLFTCLAVRAVHLEVVDDLSADEGLLALRRMIATRGVPALITSDNALHFKLIADIVANAYCVENKIKWRFIPELAPWHGGFYERLVGLVKHCMRRTLQKHLLKDSQLLTMIKEIEAVINTRPLTCVDTELEHILKPSDFLQPGKCVTLETADNNALVQGTSTKTNLIMGWRKSRIMLDEFKEMFQNRYLPTLRERYSHLHKQPRVTSKLTPKEGQIVQMKGDKNREGWKVGRIVSLIKGSDGLVRVARVKVGETIFTRSVAHLYPLEIEDNEQPDTIPQDKEKFESPRLTEESPEDTELLPHVITQADVAQKETTANQEIDEEMTDDRVSVTNKEPDLEIESADTTDRVQNEDLRDHSNNMVDKDSMKDKDMSTEEDRPEEVKIKRIAAAKALEKIREWTQNLMSTLF